MNEHFSIRNLRPDELAVWLDFMCEEIFPGDPREAVEEMWHGDGEKNFAGIFIAADPDNAIIGSVKAGCRSLSLLGCPVPAGIISGVGTRRDLRGKGISRQLFSACHASLLERGVVVTHLYSKPDTLQFYHRLGYLATAQRPGEDFRRMYRVLRPFDLGAIPVPDTQTLIRLLDQTAPA